jgi:hypothetical protein
VDLWEFLHPYGVFYRISVPPAATKPPASNVAAASNPSLSYPAGCPAVAWEVDEAEESKEFAMFDATLTQACLTESNRALQMWDRPSTIRSPLRKNNFDFCIAINQIYAMVYIFQ